MRLSFPVLLPLLAVPLPALAGTIVVPLSVPTIQAGLDAAAPGDTVLVFPGTYREHDVVMKSGVTLAGDPGVPDAVTIDAGGAGRAIVGDGLDAATTITGITFTGGFLAGTCPDDSGTGAYCMGGALLLASSSPHIDRCVFRGNSTDDNGGAVSLVYSSPVLTECRFEENSSYKGGGMSIVSAGFDVARPLLDRCVFDGNSANVDGGAVFVFFAAPTFTGCTFRGNAAGGKGAGIYSHTSFPIVVTRTILAFNQGAAVHCFDGTEPPSVTCTDVFGNAGGDWTGCLADQEGTARNLAADPLFCAPAAGYLTLRVDSPCAPDTNPCGLVGALGVGCGPVSVKESSWGAMKGRYR